MLGRNEVQPSHYLSIPTPGNVVVVTGGLGKSGERFLVCARLVGCGVNPIIEDLTSEVTGIVLARTSSPGHGCGVHWEMRGSGILANWKLHLQPTYPFILYLFRQKRDTRD